MVSGRGLVGGAQDRTIRALRDGVAALERALRRQGAQLPDQLGGALETEPRYVLLDHDYTTTDGRPADKIILISWIPDTSPVMKKMKYAGTKEAVKSALQGIAINLNATDMAEAALSEIEAACKKI